MQRATMFAAQSITEPRPCKSNDVMFEPEEELSVTQEKLNKMENVLTGIEAKLRRDVDSITSNRAGTIHNAMDALKVDSIELDTTDAQPATEKSPKKEKKQKKRKPKLRLEHLPCCIENVQLQDALEAAEAHIQVQDEKMKEMKNKSAELLGQLTAEIHSLKARMSSTSIPESDQVFSLRVQLEMATMRTRMEKEELQKQLESQNAKVIQLEASLTEAENEALESKTKLAENWKSHGQEISTLQQQLVEEKSTHCSEVQRLRAELEEVQATAKEALARATEQPIRASDEMLANAHQDIVKLEEKVLQVCCENLKADKELQFQTKAKQDVVEQCIKLHGPAGNLITLFGQPVLPQFSSQSANDFSVHVRWLDQLCKSLIAIHQQLQSRVDPQ